MPLSITALHYSEVQKGTDRDLHFGLNLGDPFAARGGGAARHPETPGIRSLRGHTRVEVLVPGPTRG